MIFLSLLLIPVLIALCGLIFGRGKITPKEFGLHLLAQLFIAIISAAVIYHQNVIDTETLNGAVINKKRVEVHCRHSYSCHCVTISCGKGCVSTICQTCYDHDYDVDWNVYSNIGDWGIDTLDRQGLKEPPRWTIVKVGEPVSKQDTYENYIKGAPGTLFKDQGLEEKYKAVMPDYPGTIYDYYRNDRVVTIGYALPELKQWVNDVSTLNSIVGYQKGCNIILVVGRKLNREYFYALSQHWIGGKKNDITVLISMDGERLEWAQVMAWTDHELFKVKLRNALMDIGKLDRAEILKAIDSNVRKEYVRKSMKDFKYLQASIKPTTTQWMWAMAIGAIVSILLTIFFYKEDI